MLCGRTGWRPFRRDPVAAFRADDGGATAVEFGLVALPFFAMLGALVQVALVLWAQQNLDYTFQKAVRTVFTGQFQQTNDQTASAATLLSALRTGLCGSGSVVTVFTCNNVKLDLTLGKNFATTSPVTIIDPGTKDWSPSFGTHYSCATPGSIVIATAAVKFPVFFGLLDSGISNFADGSKLLHTTAVFRTEPYSTGGGTGC